MGLPSRPANAGLQAEPTDPRVRRSGADRGPRAGGGRGGDLRGRLGRRRQRTQAQDHPEQGGTAGGAQGSLDRPLRGHAGRDRAQDRDRRGHAPSAQPNPRSRDPLGGSADSVALTVLGLRGRWAGGKARAALALAVAALLIAAPTTQAASPAPKLNARAWILIDPRDDSVL